ncbi:hypothetical protein HPB47_013360, partial [Ixodes persulcatus]
MATATPSLTASQKTPTERYSMPPSTCGSSIAELENEASVTNLAEVRAPDHGLHISAPNAGMLTSDMEIADPDQGEWYDAKTSKKRKNNSSSSKSGDTVTNSPTTTVGLTVIFVPAVENQKITAISSLKLSVALEQLCPECIHEINPNSRLNLIAVDTRNGQTTRALLACTQIRGLKVRAYEPIPRHFAVGVIKDVDTSLSDAKIEQHMRSLEGRVARIRRLGQSSIVKIAFSETTLPSFVYLGHVRHPVTPFKERPIQCRKCCGYGHREANCKRPPICSRCGEAHDSNDTCSGQEKCANCSQAHAATSSSSPKWQRESETRSYARKHAVDFRAARKEEDKINVLIRRVYKIALSLPESTGTDRLFQLGIHNTLNEIAEAQRTSQLERLSGTNAGRRILENLGIGYHTQQGHKVTIPYNRGRREARAKALLNAHSNNVGTQFVDADEYERGSRFAMTVVDSDGETKISASVACERAEEAEEIAVALALTDPACKTVLCDSRQVIRNFAKGRISLRAARIISQRQVHREPEPPTRLLWFPAHVGEVSEEHRNGNETAHARARELTNRTGDGRPPSLDDQLWAVQQACEAVKRQDFDAPRGVKRTSGNAPKR